MLKRIRDNFKMKYLTLLLVIPALFMFTGTKGREVLYVSSWEELEEYVVYRSSREDLQYEFSVRPTFNNTDFKKPDKGYSVSDFWCGKLKGAIKNYDKFIGNITKCIASVEYTNSDLVVFYEIYNNLDEVSIGIDHNVLKDYFDEKIQEMIKEGKDKANVVLELRNLVNDMVRYNNATEFNFDHPLLEGGGSRDMPPALKHEAHNILFSIALSRMDIGLDMVASINSPWDGEGKWPIVKIDNNWYHCPANVDTDCLISDAEILNFGYSAWDVNDYPKASVSYNFNQKSSSAALAEEREILPRPVDVITSDDDYYRDENIELKMKGVSDWAYEPVLGAIKEDIVPVRLTYGYTNWSTRKDITSLLVNMVEKIKGEELPYPSISPFEDVSIYIEFDVSALKAYSYGITKGVSETRFAPGDYLTREQVATMMVRTIKLLEEEGITSAKITRAAEENPKVNFADESEISDWAKEEVEYLAKVGIIKGMGNNKFVPAEWTTSEQLIALTYRLYLFYK